MKKTVLYLFLMLLGLLAAKAQTPFDGFDSQMAGMPINKTKESPKFRISVQDSTNTVAYLELNVEERLLGFYTHNDRLLAIARIEDNKVKFLS